MSPAAPRIDSVMDLAEAAVADVYAEALLGLIDDNDRAEETAAELARIVGLLDETPGFDGLLAGGGSPEAQPAQLVERVFAGRCSRPIEGLLAVLARKGRGVLLRQVARRFRRRLDEREGKVEVTVATAVALDAANMQALHEVLRELTGAEPLLRTRVDTALMGGVVVTIGDRRYDASVAGEIRRVRHKLAAEPGSVKRGWEDAEE